ncbi:MAG TPA: hypothetical protein VFF64_04805 [Candidatus Eremiobacteraceae bacterium]|nr:hypothetical protein [Candidatus Eremiobacteraceae bacterium]
MARAHSEIPFAQRGLGRGQITNNNAQVVLVGLRRIQIDADRHSSDFDLEKFVGDLTDDRGIRVAPHRIRAS